MENKEKDRWDKADIISKALGALMTPLIIALVAIVGNNIIQSRQDREVRTRLYSELMGKREEAESLIRKDMFMSILDSFLKNDSSSTKELSLTYEVINEKILKLELLTYNFHELLNIGPLFLNLLREVKLSESLKENERNELGDRINRIANEIIRKQMFTLEGSGKRFNRTFEFYETSVVLESLPTYRRFPNPIPRSVEFPEAIKGKIEYSDELQRLVSKGIMTKEEKEILYEMSPDESFRQVVNQLFDKSQKLNEDGGLLKLEDDGTFKFKERIERIGKLKLKDIERSFKVILQGVNFKTKELDVRLEVETVIDGKEGINESPSITEFWLGFFDFPMIDNTRLSDDQRCAVVLTGFTDLAANFTLVYFDASRASMKEKPYYEEVYKKLLVDLDKP